MANQIELKIEAEQYLTQMKAKYQRETRAWEQFAKEIPEKLVQLIKSGFSTNISRANNYNSGGGRTIGINISLNSKGTAGSLFSVIIPHKPFLQTGIRPCLVMFMF